MQSFKINILWDDEAKVWIATSEDIPGLCAEAESLESLIDIAKSLAPDLLLANGVIEPGLIDIPLDMVAHRQEMARMSA